MIKNYTVKNHLRGLLLAMAYDSIAQHSNLGYDFRILKKLSLGNYVLSVHSTNASAYFINAASSRKSTEKKNVKRNLFIVSIIHVQDVLWQKKTKLFFNAKLGP